MAYDIRPFLTLSTAHVTPKTRDWLNAQGEIAAEHHRTRQNPEIHVAPNIYGWSFYCDEDPDENFPEDIVAIMKFARAQNCEYVMLDCDGDQLDELPKYVW